MNWVLAAGAGGFNPPTEEEFHWPPIFEIHLGAVDLSINRPVILTWLVVLIVGGLLYAAFAKPKLIPGKFQNLMETAVEFVRKEIIIEVLGPEHGPRWVPYLTTLFFFVFVGNLFEVIPLINLPTNFRSANTWFLAIFSLIIFVSVGIASQGPVKYLKSVMAPPGVPVFVLPLIAIIEVFSTFIIRPLTLSVRLLGNMIAGHFLLLIFWFGTAYLLQPSIAAAFSVVSFGMSVALVGFELVVALLQAYIFTILTAVYIAGAVQPEH